MVRRVLWYLFIALIIVLILAWLIGGGISKIQSAAKNFSFSGVWGGVSAFDLPWAIPIPQGPDISNLTGGQSGSGQQTSQAATLGNQSPYSGSVSISADGADSSDPQTEYVTIQNTGTATIDITNWSLQSALSGARAYLPRGASFFEIGQVNAQNDIELAPGGVAIVTTGNSPVGTSFEENECSGYLEQLQAYTPPIETQCPSPGNAASAAEQYGDSCAQYVSSLPFCTFPQNPPSGISSQCAAYVQTTFSYNGCVQSFQNDPDFASTDWRIYLDATHELWNNDHDTIRLLDGQGETVAVTSY
jgi:hypothetical protein